MPPAWTHAMEKRSTRGRDVVGEHVFGPDVVVFRVRRSARMPGRDLGMEVLDFLPARNRFVLYSGALQFCRTSGGEIPPVGRGRARIRDMLEQTLAGTCMLSTNHRAIFANSFDISATIARDVDPSIVPLPEEAGCIKDPGDPCHQTKQLFSRI